jgi:hypothetical protein
MNVQWIGLIAAASTFSGIWFGHVAIRKIEYLSPNIWLPSLVALLSGLVLESGALASESKKISALLGILGVTLLWDSIEFWRQQNRVRNGRAPANPDNPRHSRILAEFNSATTIDWLDRIPVGRQLSPEELQAIQERST